MKKLCSQLKDRILVRLALVVILCAIFTFSFSIKAQSQGLNPEKKLNQYILQKWDSRDGLSTESINDIIQTPDGYIWIATYIGLHRFDGLNFTIFKSSNSNIPSSNVLKLSLDNEGRLWLGSLHGLAYYENGNFITPLVLQEVADMSIENMIITSNNAIWFSAKSGQLFRYDNGKLQNLTPKLPKMNTITAIEEVKNGDVYIGTSDSKLFKYTAKNVFEEIEVGVEVNGINCIYAMDQNIYVGTSIGLYKVVGNTLIKLKVLQTNTITSLIKDFNNNLWIGTFLGLYRYNLATEGLDSLTENLGLANNNIRAILFDHEQNFWGGTYRGGIFNLYDGIITSYAKRNGLDSDIISGIAEIGPNRYLLGNENGILNILNNDGISEYRPPIALPKDRLKHMLTDSRGRVWVSTYGGLYILDGDNSRQFTVANGFPDNYVRMAFEDRNGLVWVGTKNSGLLKFDANIGWSFFESNDSLTSKYIMSIKENAQGNLVVGTISGINVINDDQIIKKISIEDGLPSSFSFSTYSERDNLWIASNDGLIKYSKDTVVVFNRNMGMPTDIIYDILPDESGNLWLPSEKSILKVSLKALENVLKKPNAGIDLVEFDESQGMLNSNCLGAVLSVEDSKGNFWIPTQGGVVHVSPSIELNLPTSIPIIIERVAADSLNLSLDEIVVPSGINRLTLKYTGISYNYTHKLQFRYKLLPYDREWVYGGNLRQAQYTNLPPGEYEFQIQIGIGDIYYDNFLSRQVIIKASWWQTIWAKLAALILAVAFGLLFYMYRVKSLTYKNAKLEMMVKERTFEIESQKQELRVALRNLSEAQEQMVQSEKMASLGVLSAGVAHEINNPLNFIHGGMMALEAIDFTNHPEVENIEKLVSIIKQGIKRTSDIVASLNEFSHHQNAEKIPCDIHHIIDNCLVMVQYQTAERITIKKKYTKKNHTVYGSNGEFHQVFLNIITNAIHAISDKGNIRISTDLIGKHMVVIIKDNGQGMTEQTIKKITEPFYTTKAPGKGTGLGLSIVYNIIKKYSGSLEFDSSPGEGTTTIVRLPIE